MNWIWIAFAAKRNVRKRRQKKYGKNSGREKGMTFRKKNKEGDSKNCPPVSGKISLLFVFSAAASTVASVSAAAEQEQEDQQAVVISPATETGTAVAAAAQQKKDPYDVASAGISVKQAGVSGITSTSTVCSS